MSDIAAAHLTALFLGGKAATTQKVKITYIEFLEFTTEVSKAGGCPEKIAAIKESLSDKGATKKSSNPKT